MKTTRFRSVLSRFRLETLEDRSVPATFTVTNLNDSGAGSLRDAITSANADNVADTIVFNSGLASQTISLSTIGDSSVGPAAFAITSPVTITGSGQTISRTGATNFRLFTVTSTGDLTLQNLTLANGQAQGFTGGSGGGSAGLGGAIYNQGTLHIFNSTLAGNSAIGGAGGSTAGNPLGGSGLGSSGDNSGNGGSPSGGLVGATAGAAGETGGFGGGGGAGADGSSGAGGAGGSGGFGGGGGSGGKSTSTGAGGAGGVGGFGGGGGGGGTSSGGSQGAGGVGGFGGGFGAGGGATLNGVGGGGAGLGGAVFNQGGTVTIANSTIANNIARGGNASSGAGAGSGYGGGVFNLNGTVSLANVTIAKNTVAAGSGSGAGQASGGAFYNNAFPVGSVTPTQNATLNVVNSIFANSTGGPDIANNQTTGSATINFTTPSLISISISNGGGTINGTSTLLVTDPILGALQNNGGLTQTMALQSGSPALNVGDNSAVTSGNLGGSAPFNDQRGSGFLRISNAKVDLGAVETQVPAVLTPSNLPAGAVGTPYNQAITVTGPTGTFTFTSSPSGTIAGGLTLSSTGVLSGTPTTAGTFNLQVTATSTSGESATAFYSLTIASTSGVFAAFGGTPNGKITTITASSGVLTANTVSTTVVPVFNSLVPGIDKVTIRPLVADFTGDGINDLVYATGPGVTNTVIFLDGNSSGTDAAQYRVFSPFESTFTGGALVSAGDINGDGVPDLIVTPDQGGGGVVAIFDGTKITQSSITGVAFGQTAEITRFFGIEDPNFRGGARSTAGDINGDGKIDVVVAAGFGGGPRIAIYNGATVTTTRTKLLGDFFIFENTLRNGSNLSAGDFNGDGKADLAFGGGPGGGPRVRIVDGATLLSVNSPFDANGIQTVNGLVKNDFFTQTSNFDSQGATVLARPLSTTSADLIVGFVATTGTTNQTFVQQLNYYKNATLSAAVNVTTVDQTLQGGTVSIGVGGPYVG